MVNDQLHHLAKGRIVPCKDTAPFTNYEARERLKPLPGWFFEEGSIRKRFRFKSYLSGLDFAYRVGKIAEQKNHHPDILVGWRYVIITFSTHAIKGLSQNDFVMAAKTELEYDPYTRSEPKPASNGSFLNSVKCSMPHLLMAF